MLPVVLLTRVMENPSQTRTLERKKDREKETEGVRLVPAGIPFFFLLLLSFKIRTRFSSLYGLTRVSLIIIYFCVTSGVCSRAHVNEPQPEPSSQARCHLLTKPPRPPPVSLCPLPAETLVQSLWM